LINVRKLCELLLPKNTVAEIKYFTALVSARLNDPDQPRSFRRKTERRSARS
jgi:hypothetical protein